MNQATDPNAQLGVLVDQLYPKYDESKSGKLDIKQLTGLFNEAFEKLGVKASILSNMAEGTFRKVDRNFDGSASKEEAYYGLRQYLMDYGFFPKPPSNLGSSGPVPIGGTTNPQPPTQQPSIQIPSQTTATFQQNPSIKTGQEWGTPPNWASIPNLPNNAATQNQPKASIPTAPLTQAPQSIGQPVQANISSQPIHVAQQPNTSSTNVTVPVSQQWGQPSQASQPIQPSQPLNNPISRPSVNDVSQVSNTDM